MTIVYRQNNLICQKIQTITNRGQKELAFQDGNNTTVCRNSWDDQKKY